MDRIRHTERFDRAGLCRREPLAARRHGRADRFGPEYTTSPGAGPISSGCPHALSPGAF